jgi:malate dehydrogenase (oxaloacetate-decarboxylating)(NADP+)
MTTPIRGTSLLRDPRLNKSTAFTQPEREALGLVGLLPEGIDSEETQLQRVLLQLGQKPTNLEKYIFLSQVQDMVRRHTRGRTPTPHADPHS